jgi:hypothetical protein
VVEREQAGALRARVVEKEHAAVHVVDERQSMRDRRGMNVNCAASVP